MSHSENSQNRSMEGLGGAVRTQMVLLAQRSVIATDRKYQEAFNYQQCYHIIATNNRRSGASVQRREQILLTLATGVRKTASIIELF